MPAATQRRPQATEDTALRNIPTIGALILLIGLGATGCATRGQFTDLNQRLDDLESRISRAESKADAAEQRAAAAGSEAERATSMAETAAANAAKAAASADESARRAEAIFNKTVRK
jgi:murein lipoprotein